MSKEKSQLENIALPSQDGDSPQPKTEPSPALPAGFSLGKQLIADDKPTPKSETLKHFLPGYPAGPERMSEEERELRAKLEKEEMNYDLYLLIKERLAGEFGEKLDKNIFGYDILKKNDIQKLIQENPKLYTPNPKDLQFIVNNLREFFPKIKKTDYFSLGVFVNSFIHSYFNSVPEEKRKDLKLNLLNTKDLNFIGSELIFGELEVEEVKNFFGYEASGSAILKAGKVEDFAGNGIHGNAQMLVMEEAGNGFGHEAYDSAILKAGKVGNEAGRGVRNKVQILVEEAGNFFGKYARGSAILSAIRVMNAAGVGIYGNVQMFVEEVGKDVGFSMRENAKITIGKKYQCIGGKRKNNAKIVLPSGRVLMPGDTV